MTETTPFLQPRRSHGSLTDISEEEIINYVAQRRASIASVGTTNFPDFSTSHTVAHERLTSIRSHASSHADGDRASRLVAEPETSVAIETRALLKFSVPLIATFLLKYSLTVALVFSVGRLGLDKLAAVSLSSMTANISGYAIIQGVSTCLDTLCAQAYGRKDYHMVGVHFVRCCYLLLLLCVPMVAFWLWGVEPLLLAIVGDDQQEACKLAAQYLRVLGWGLPGYILFENAAHFLQCQGIFHALTYVLMVCAPLNAVLNYYLVWDPRIGLGFVGAPLSVVITDWLMCFAIFGYIFFVKGRECWPKHSLLHPSLFSNWKRMLDLSGPGVILVEAEWLAFEIITFVSSLFGTEVLAAQSILTTTCALLYQIPLAISITASTRVAWYIGAASKRAAKTAANAANITSVTLGTVNAVFTFTFRHLLAALYTNDQEVVAIAAHVLIIAAVYQINDFLSCLTGGILRGQGRQRIGGYVNLISYYLIAMPSAFFFAFGLKLELVGLWLGMITALVVGSLLQLYFVVTSDWDAIINECINEAVFEEH